MPCCPSPTTATASAAASRGTSPEASAQSSAATTPQKRLRVHGTPDRERHCARKVDVGSMHMPLSAASQSALEESAICAMLNLSSQPSPMRPMRTAEPPSDVGGGEGVSEAPPNCYCGQPAVLKNGNFVCSGTGDSWCVMGAE